MIYTYTTSDDGLVCKPWGNLDFSSSFALRHVVHDALDRQTRVLIDLSRVESIEAVGLSAIIGCLRRGRTLGAIVQVANVSPHVRRRIDMMGATRAFADTFGLSEIGSRSTSDRHGNTIPRMSGAARPASVVQRRVSSKPRRAAKPARKTWAEATDIRRDRPLWSPTADYACTISSPDC